MNCPICADASSFFVSKKDRFDQECRYFKCQGCRFLFDEDLALDKSRLEIKTSKVYDSDYFKSVDIGWKMRGDKIAKVINFFIGALRFFKNGKINALDYGGGNGYVASLIDKDVNLFYYDKYETPTYLKNYTILQEPKEANLVYAVELVEHLSDMNEWDALAALSKNMFIFTTEVSDGVEEKELVNWAYLNPDAGHTIIYSFKALHLLAKKYGFFYFFFPYKLSHIFIRGRFLSKFNFVNFEYVLYVFFKKIKDSIR
jgi:hypothetical protein